MNKCVNLSKDSIFYVIVNLEVLKWLCFCPRGSSKKSCVISRKVEKSFRTNLVRKKLALTEPIGIVKRIIFYCIFPQILSTNNTFVRAQFI